MEKERGCQKMQDNRAFQQMLQPAKERVCLHSPEDIARKSGAVFYEEDSSLEVQSFHETVRITFPDCIFQPEIAGWHQLVLLHYLDLADGTDVSPEMIPFGSLKDGLIRGTKFDRYMDAELERFLTGKTREQLCGIFRGLGGEFVEGRADLCAVFPFLPRYPLRLNIWLADEEFEASGKLLVSRSADHYLTIEDAVTVGDIFLSKLT